jgi:hypothetical protein
VRPQRCLDSSYVTVVVSQNSINGESAALEVGRDELCLITAELEKQHAPRAHEAHAVSHDAPEQSGAVASAVVRELRFEGERVALQEWQLRRRDVWDHGGDNVDASVKRALQR